MTVQILQTLLQHITIITDGNCLWAQKRRMPRTVGHAKGVAGIKALVEHCAKLGVKYLAYLFLRRKLDSSSMRGACSRLGCKNE